MKKMRKIIGVLAVALVLIVNFIPTNAAGSNRKIISDENVDKNTEINENMRLVSVEELDNGMTLYVYIENIESEVVGRSVGASQGSKYYYYKVAGYTVVTVKGTISYTYGHSDGIARVTSVNYTILQAETGYTLSNFTKSYVNSTSAQNSSYGRITFKLYNSYTKETHNITMNIYVNNNGTVW